MNPIHLNILIGVSILGLLRIFCSTITLISNIFYSWLPAKSAPADRRSQKKKYWERVKDDLNAKRRANRRNPIPTITLELPTGGNDGNGGGNDGNGGGDDGKSDKGQNEFDSKISLIELLLNILSFLLPLLIAIYNWPAHTQAYFNLDIVYWTNALNSLFDYINNSHPHYIDYYNYILNTFNDFNGTAVQTDSGQTVYAIAIDNRDDIIQRLNNLINIIREILSLIHPNYMEEIDTEFPDWMR